MSDESGATSSEAPSRHGAGGSFHLKKEPDAPCPPSVIRGAKLHDAEVGLDWLRFTLPFNRRYLMTNRLAKYLGRYVSKPGMWGYRERYQFASGAFVAFTDSSRECCVELTGETCQQLGHDSLMELMTWAYNQLARATRIDVRLDFKASHVGLIDQVRDACHRKELCRSRVYKKDDEHVTNGLCTGYSIQLGKRGKNGSGRFVRVYDKGLQTGDAPKGQWERWETEFSDDAANQVCMKLIHSDNWNQTASELTLGAVEFREHTGSRSLKRRKLAHWWANLTKSINPILVKIQRPKTTLDRYGAWLRRSVLPGIHTMAHESGQTPSQVMDFFTGNDNLATPIERASPAVWGYLDILQTCPAASRA